MLMKFNLIRMEFWFILKRTTNKWMEINNKKVRCEYNQSQVKCIILLIEWVNERWECIEEKGIVRKTRNAIIMRLTSIYYNCDIRKQSHQGRYIFFLLFIHSWVLNWIFHVFFFFFLFLCTFLVFTSLLAFFSYFFFS